MHHVHARTPRFASGGDDYLYFILFHGSVPGARYRLASHRLRCRRSRDRCAADAVGMRLLYSSCVPYLPMALAGCGLLLYTRAALGS
jgi:hypothetical protein